MKPEELTADDLDTLAKLQRTVFGTADSRTYAPAGKSSGREDHRLRATERAICSARGWAGFASQSGGVLRKLWTTCSRG